MKKVLIAYFSRTGTTEKMAEYIAEGVRFSEQEVTVKKIEDIKSAKDLAGYDGYIFGSPTYSQDIAGPMKAFLSMAQGAGLEGKLGGAFGPHTHNVGYSHDNIAPVYIFEALQRLFKMEPFELGALTLKESAVETTDGIRACQDYGRVFGQKLRG